MNAIEVATENAIKDAIEKGRYWKSTGGTLEGAAEDAIEDAIGEAIKNDIGDVIVNSI